MIECHSVHSVHNVHLEKRYHSCLFLRLYQWRINWREPQSGPQPIERKGSTFLLQWEESLFGLLKWQHRIQEWHHSFLEVWLDFVPFLESEGDALRMTDCLERKLCRNLLTPLNFTQEGTRGQKTAWALTCKFLLIILIRKELCAWTTSKQFFLIPYRLYTFRWSLSLKDFYMECSILSRIKGGYFMRRRGKMQTKERKLCWIKEALGVP